MSALTQTHWKLETDTVGELTRVRLEGQDIILDEADTSVLEDQLTRLVEEAGRCRLVLDLGNVAYLSSSTLTVFLRLHKRLQAVGGSFVLVKLLPQVEEILQVTNLDRVLDVRVHRRAV